MNGQLQPVYNPHVHLYADANGIPYPTQTAPTQILYERARQAATAKASPTNRRAGTPSQRRPWTTEEENALMAGLDRVKGPHWSQILAMFGPGGTINESLKDRNQVQLKDKARNLKLFFLKSNIEVPYYLSFVTGELKTRAPASATRPDDVKTEPGEATNGDHAQSGPATPLGPLAAEHNASHDQTPIPTIGEHAGPPVMTPAGPANAPDPAREAMIAAQVDEKVRKAADAAAEAAAAIALMGQAGRIGTVGS
jgi:hypothetical protein